MAESPFASIGRGYYPGAGPEAQQPQPPRRRPEPQPAPSMGPASLGQPKSLGQQMGSGSPTRPAYGPHTVTAASARPMQRPVPSRQRPMYGSYQPPRQPRAPYLGPQQQGMAPPPEPMNQPRYPSLAGMDMGRGPEMVDDGGYQDDLQSERLRMMLAQRQRGGYY